MSQNVPSRMTVAQYECAGIHSRDELSIQQMYWKNFKNCKTLKMLVRIMNM
jgi:hypothetical protein